MIVLKAKKLSPLQLQAVVAVLKSGGIIVYPTDTVYSLGCDATNPQAVKKIFLIKGRKEIKPLPNICVSLAMAKRYAKFSPLALLLAQKYWPGALNLALPVKLAGAKLATARQGKIGLRVPKFSLALQLAQALNKPLVSTSANVSGLTPCYNIKEIMAQFKSRKNQPDLIIDAGQLSRKNKPSTVVEVKNNKFKVLRQGKIVISK